MTTSTPRPTLLIISFSRIVSDARVLKQVALLRNDYEVTTCGYGEAPGGVAEHVEIPESLIAWRLDRLSTVLRRFERTYWRQEVVAWAQEHLEIGAHDIVLANDVETVPLALALEPRLGVHADLHEYAPRQKEDLRRWRRFVAPYQRYLCRRYIARASSWTTVATGLAAEYRREFGFTPEVVVNAAPFQNLEPEPASVPLRLVHSGGAMPSRHLEIMIDAVANCESEPTLDMYLVPANPSYVDALREYAASRCPDRVRILDPLPYATLHRALSAYDIGIYVAPPVSFNHLWMLPNKVFDFVQARLALIVSPNPEMKHLVTEHGLGRVTGGYTAEDLRREIDSFSVDEVMEAKAASHRSATELSAESVSDSWRRAIDALADRSPRRNDR